MPSETTDIMRPVKDQNHHQLTDPAAAAALAPAPITIQPPKPTDMLPCPRCGSGSTKFCYYNNYNLSQPRYFCKGCRRYWTQGGTLRCVPVGGGTRKNASSSSSSASKRSRSSSASSTSTNSSNSTTSNTSAGQEPVPVSASGSEVHHPELIKAENNTTTTPYGLNLNEKFEPVITTDSTGNFMSLLNCQDPPMLGMSGYGSGFGYGFYDMGLAFNSRVGTNIWSYPGIPTGSVTDGAACVAGGDANPGCNTWQVGHDVGGGGGNGGAGGGVVDDGGDYFSWPGLAISTPGKTFK